MHLSAVKKIPVATIRFSRLFAAGDASRRETSPAAKSVEKRMFSQAMSVIIKKVMISDDFDINAAAFNRINTVSIYRFFRYGLSCTSQFITKLNESKVT